MSKKRRTFSAEFKARVALEALKENEPINAIASRYEVLKENEPINAIASRYEVLPVQVSQWKTQALENLAGSFTSERKKASREMDWQRREAHLFRKIGQLEVERDWLKKKSEELGILPGGEARYD